MRRVKVSITGRAVLLAAIVTVIVASVITFAIYQSRVKPFRTTIIEVDGSKINMRYFLKRAAMVDGKAMETLETLTKEAIIRQTAVKPPYNIEVLEEDIDQFIRDMARWDNESIEESEFKEWYRQLLNENRLSDAEYRELVRTTLLNLRLSDYLGESMPNVADHVRVSTISVGSESVGDEVKHKHDAGADFADLAKEYATEQELKDRGGDIGWIARGSLDPRFDEVAFDIEIGKCSTPFYLDDETIVVIMVSERVADRELDVESLWLIKSRTLDSWYDEEYRKHDVQIHGFTNGYDSTTNAWVEWQLSRMAGS